MSNSSLFWVKWLYQKIHKGSAFVVLALAIGAASFIILLDLTPIVPSRFVAFVLIVLNSTLVLLLLGKIWQEFLPTVTAWRARRKASRLHIRIVTLFCLVATLPALAIAIIGVVSLNLGLDRWFNKTTSEIITSSVNIANVYARETLQTLSISAYGMAFSLDNKELLLNQPMEYRRRMTIQAAARNLRGAFLLSSNGDVYLSASLPHQAGVPIPSAELIAKARFGEPFLFQPGIHGYFGVILKFENMNDSYLYIVRDVDENILHALRLTDLNTERYGQLVQTRVPTQIVFWLLYTLLFLVMLLSAIWAGTAVADRLVKPIRLLIDAADGVAAGNLDIKPLPSDPTRGGDISLLIETFNYMVQELKTQRQELIAVRDQIDERRRFSEAVLRGVTAGVVGVDGHAHITIMNRSAERMFQVRFSDIVGQSLAALNKEIHAVFCQAGDLQKRNYRDHIIVARAGHSRVYNVQITWEDSQEAGCSCVVTIDDITELVEAQRSAAWANVARRIAHEIKNPLTPIQLSVQRVQKRYADSLGEGREVFDLCMDTIIRQVETIELMVNEFSSFARMPKPKLEKLDLRLPLRDAAFLIAVSRSDIIFEQDFGESELIGCFDKGLVTQAVSNLIKNATESIDAARLRSQEAGRILICAYIQKGKIIVEIIDNGKGLPQQEREKLLEPYITTRKKGTGLGLAIVKKIVEDHAGQLELYDAPKEFYGGKGAMIRISFPQANNC